MLTWNRELPLFLNGKAEGNTDEDEMRMRMKSYFKCNTVRKKLQRKALEHIIVLKSLISVYPKAK